MKYYQIKEVEQKFNHAGTKATQDICDVAAQLGFQEVQVRMNTFTEGKISKLKRQMGYYKDWNAAFKTIESNSIVLLQHPFHHKQLTREKILTKLKEEKHVKYISLIHDVEELRAFRYNDYYKQEFEFMMNIADVLIVHNDVMKEFFIQRGFPKEKIISLEIFDYLQKENQKEILFEKSITVAGNLDTTKCGYIQGLKELKEISIHLYGPNYDENMQQENIQYHGSFPVDEIPNHLNKGFGLVWDGSSIHGCQGLSGQYVRYNNPHKLSLYLSSGIPVIIWKEAAEAAFVEKNKVGICVEDLKELDSILNQMNAESYDVIVQNVKKIQEKLIHGDYARKALEKARVILC